MNRRTRAIAFAAVFAVVLAIPPARTAASDPLLILVSIDGWRWDYTDTLPVPHLRALAARGVRVSELVPTFPVLTFPNHYTIVTGLYPEHHGIVGNTMTDPAFRGRFSMSSPEKTATRWWGGEPLWVTAARQGRQTAALFWPGSESEIGGIRPTYWQPYDASIPAARRADQIIEWLQLPSDRRPAFISLYFEDVDHAGHDFGPDSPELTNAAVTVDKALGVLVEFIASHGLGDRATVVVVSDHGMTSLSDARTIWLDDFIDVTAVDITEADGVLLLAPRENSPARVAALFRRLKDAHPRLHVFTRDTLPKRLHYSKNPRIAPIIGIPDDGWTVTTRERRERRRAQGRLPQRGTHGYDPADRNMHALFVAAGPELRQGAIVPTLENVHLYEFLCKILKVTPAPNDGDPTATALFFR